MGRDTFEENEVEISRTPPSRVPIGWPPTQLGVTLKFFHDKSVPLMRYLSSKFFDNLLSLSSTDNDSRAILSAVLLTRLTDGQVPQ